MSTTMQTFLVFMQFLKRDLHVHAKQIRKYLLNYIILYPASLSIQVAYFQANSYFGTQNTSMHTLLYTGNILLIMLLFTYKQNITLLFDLETTRFIDYEITILKPWLVVLKRILCTAIMTFLITLPFYPVGMILLPNHIDMSNASWFQILILLLIGSFCTSAYHLLAAVTLKRSSDISSLWQRVNSLLMLFGGFWVPWITMYQYSKVLGYCAYLNPLIYISDGLKNAVMPHTIFFPFSLCISMLLFYSVFFTIICWFVFKKRVDCL